MLTDRASADRTYAMVEARQASADTLRKYFEEDWDTVIDVYMSNRRMAMPPGTEWMSDSIMPELYYGLESLLPSIVYEILRNPRSFSVYAPTLAGERVQRRVEAMLRMDRRKADLENRCIPWIRLAMLTGTLGFKNVYMQEMGEKRIPVYGNQLYDAQGQLIDQEFMGYDIRWELCHNGPWTEFLDPYLYWKSSERDYRGNPLWVIEEVPISIEYMHEQNRKFKEETGSYIYDPNVLKKYNTSASFRPTHLTSGVVPKFLMQQPRYRRSAMSRVSGVPDNQLYGDMGWFKAYYGPVADRSRGGRNYDDTQHRYMLFGPDGRKIRDIPMPTPNLRPPHREAYIMRIGDEPYGRAPARWSIDEILNMSELRILRLAEAWINALGGYVASRRVQWEQGDFVKYPGFVWYYDSLGEQVRPDEVLMKVQKNPILPEMYREIDEMSQRVRQILGTDLNTMGEAYGRRTTGYEVSEIDRKAGGKISLQASMLTHGFEQKTMQDYFELRKTFTRGGIELPVQGDDFETSWIEEGEFDFDIDIFIDSGAFGRLDAVTIDAITKALPMMLNDPEMNAGLDKMKIQEMFFHRLGVQDRLVKDEDHVRRVMAEQAKLAREMALIQAAGGGGPRGGGQPIAGPAGQSAQGLPQPRPVR